MFSILIPTWNNLPYLQLCIESIRRHSAFEHEIIVHVNEGTDGTLEWVRAQGLRHTWSKGNVGVCLALNDAARLATHDWILFMNDDMVCTPGWDRAFESAVRQVGDRFAYLAAQLIEPVDTGNVQVSVADFGTGPDNFNETGLLSYVASQPPLPDRDGFAVQPMLLNRRLWHLVGGYSIEFGPGMSSDDDFLMKLWLVGCRIFRVVGAARFTTSAARPRAGCGATAAAGSSCSSGAFPSTSSRTATCGPRRAPGRRRWRRCRIPAWSGASSGCSMRCGSTRPATCAAGSRTCPRSSWSSRPTRRPGAESPFGNSRMSDSAQ